VADRAGAAGSTLGTATSARWAAEAFSLFSQKFFLINFIIDFSQKKFTNFDLEFLSSKHFSFSNIFKNFFS